MTKSNGRLKKYTIFMYSIKKKKIHKNYHEFKIQSILFHVINIFAIFIGIIILF